MAKLRFVVVGSGWRSLFYWRVAQALPERFELCALLCRTPEKAEKMHRDYGVPVSTSAQQCAALQPDLVVVAVNKAAIPQVYPLADALQDAYLSLLMEQALRQPGQPVGTAPQPWNEED